MKVKLLSYQVTYKVWVRIPPSAPFFNMTPTAYNWISKNQRELLQDPRYMGKWIAADPNGIVAISGTFDTTFEIACTKVIYNPIVLYISPRRHITYA